MTVPLAPAAEALLARYAALRDRLPGAGAVREAAAAVFRGTGFPTPAMEAWRYTNLHPLATLAFAPPRHTPVAETALAALPEGARVVLVDGQVDPALSRLPTGARVRRFRDTPSLSEETETLPLVALNTMLAEDGVVIEVAADVDAGVLHLVSLCSGESHAAAIHPRHTVRLAAGARLSLFEQTRGVGLYLHNPVFDIAVGEGARCRHVRLQAEDLGAFHLATLRVTVAAGGMYDAFTLHGGARLARSEFHARLAGPGAAIHLNGAQLLDGVRVGDITSVIAHDAPGCASRQTVKTVLDGHARGVFQGRIEVARLAQKTDGYQMNQALLLSDTAEIDSKPELRIYADDVKCSHGATVGELDADQLFYLRSRGVPAVAARALLVRAFLADALDVVSEPAIRAVLDAAVDAWWERR